MKRIISLILAICLLIPCLPVLAAGELSWTMPTGYYVNPTFEFRPFNNYHSYQNSPNFIWPPIYDATYELILTDDIELSKVLYEVKDIKFNMYTFPYTLEAGREYYWAVRYKLNGRYSEWSEPRRLYIDEKALEYTVPEISKIGDLLGEHPYFFDDNDFIKMKEIDTTHEGFLTFKKNVDAYVVPHTFSEVKIVKDANGNTTGSMSYITPVTEVYNATMLYFITGDEKYKKYALEGLERIKDFNPVDFFEWNGYTDTTEAQFVSKLAVVYDLLYNHMSDTLKNDMVKLIENNMRRVYENFGNNGVIKGSLYTDPFGSHNWRLNQTSLGAVVIFKESKLAQTILEFHLPMLANVLAPYIYEDGSYGQGVFYGSPAEYVNIANYITKSGIFEFTKKAGLENNTINLLYRWPSNWINNIGDTYNNKPQDQYQVLNLLLYASASASTKEYREYAKWMLKHSNDGSTQYFYPSTPDYIQSNANSETEVVPPSKLPNAKYFPDTGWVCMYSDIKDDNKVGMIFKSSWFGSHSHSHPDQNSFVIQGYGQNLANDVDYYDTIGSEFYHGFNVKPYAHNMITYDNGTGQPAGQLSAKGEVTGFINQRDFKLAAGDAQAAYGASISKADRDIIYINPETFIVIDDLATSGSEYQFEYWLNTPGEIGFYENKKGASIVNDDASMEVRAHWPEKITPFYIDYYAGPDLSAVTPPSVAENATDKRLYFQTDKTTATKIVTTLDVHKTADRAKYIKEEKFEDYLKLSFEDGTVCYINLGEDDEVITNDTIEFSGLAFIYNKDSYMLVKGTYANMLGKKLVSSDNKVSVAVGHEEISVSNIDAQSNVKIYTNESPEKLIKHNDIYFYDIMQNEKVSGVLWNYSESAINLNLYPGSYTLYTDKKVLPGMNKGNGVLKITIDGNTTEIPFESVYDANGNLTYDFWNKDFTGLYTVEEMHNVSIANVAEKDIINLKKDDCIYVMGDNPELKLTSLGSKRFEIYNTDEEVEFEKMTDVTIRATDFSEGGQGSKITYWQRIDNNTLQNFNTAMYDITYEIDVPEDGVYDLAMSVSTVSGTTSDKLLFINDKTGIFNIPATDLYSNLQGIRVKCNVELKAGKNKIKLMNVDNGQCIFDWIGLIKSDK